MLDTQMPRNSQRDCEPCLTVEQELLKSKDKTIQLLANALKEAADHIWDYSTGKPPEYDVSKEYLKHKELAEKYLDKKIPG